MEYDLIKLFEHATCDLFEFVPSAIALLGSEDVTDCTIQVQWRRTAGDSEHQAELTLKWNMESLLAKQPEIERQVRNRREWNDDRATQVEETAIVVAAAVMAQIEPEMRFTRRSNTGTGHDYYLNSTHDEMIEIAGRWDGPFNRLFDEKREQSDRNPDLRKRWVSVTVITKRENRTEGLHT